MANERKNNNEPANKDIIKYTIGLLQDNVSIKTLLESLAEGVIIINEKAKIVFVNKRLLEMSGFIADEVIGQSINIFIPSSYHKKHESHLSGFFNNPIVRPMGTGLELKMTKKNGDNLPVEISLSHLNSDIGKLAIAFVTNISARKKAEDELKARNKELDSYAHSVAHNLNSSLVGIINFSTLLINPDIELSREIRLSYLNEISNISLKMSSVIKELLIFASMKKEDVDESEVNSVVILNNVLDRLKFQIKEKNASIKIQDNLLNCYGYGPWIEEVWFNLISNAINYGGDPPIIEISSNRCDDNFIEFKIKDNGKGISDELKEVIFKNNNLIKEKYIKGFGIGLNITQKIITKLGGRIAVESELDKGSCFCFFIKAI